MIFYFFDGFCFSLSQLPGVDPNDPSVRDVLASLQADEEVGSITSIHISAKG